MLGLVLALGAGGCGSDDEESPPPYLDQAQIAVRALDGAGETAGEAIRLLALEPNAGRLVAVARSLDDAASLVEQSTAHTQAAIDTADEEAGRDELAAADRAAFRAAGAGRRANEQLIDAAERLDIPYLKLVSPETEDALDEASEAINEAHIEVSVALTAAE